MRYIVGLGLVCAVSILATLAVAGPGLRDGDAKLSGAEMEAFLSGQTIEFFDKSLSRYGNEGDYSYAYGPGKPRHKGVYFVNPDSTVCVLFENGRQRCDTLVDDGKRHVLIIGNGDRFPIKSRVPLQ